MMLRGISLGRARRVSEYLKNIAPGVFFQELYNRPGAIGAICPSSRYLARQMARQVPVSDDGLIIELGGGTGVITRALLDHGVAPDRLKVVEFSSPFVQRLRQRFPHIDVIHGNAADLSLLLPPGMKIRAIVSSLPLCSLPEPITRAILQQWQLLLQDGGVAIQFTYNLRLPKWRAHLKARQTESKVVWANLPPANITTFSFTQAKLTHPSHECP
ncbi:methyltransferase domain-containing protein [Pollutimonas bauzanensis]|jgi:phospholipid N-methyltransferase|uniref:class I SAM-dependent methyltransferase n=1 Tax=Pollutimonas bauzanensis TaxID=658167 RepID=UPI00333E8873